MEEVGRSKGVGCSLQSLRLGPPVDGVLAHNCQLQVQLPSCLTLPATDLDKSKTCKSCTMSNIAVL